MRYAYTPKDFRVDDSGMKWVSFSYDIRTDHYDKEIPLSGEVDLTYIDDSIQKWINSHNERIKSAEDALALKHKFSSLLGKKIDLDEDEIKSAIEQLESRG